MNNILVLDQAVIDADECICCGFCEPECQWDAIIYCNWCEPITYLVKQDKCKGGSPCSYPCINICPVAAICKKSEYQNGSCP